MTLHSGSPAVSAGTYGMLNARDLIEQSFSGHDEPPERPSSRFKWTPPGPKRRTQQGGPDDGKELPEDPNAPELDSPEGAQEMSHAELLAQGGMDRELRGDDVLDLHNQAQHYSGADRAATKKGRSAFRSQVNRLKGYAGFGESVERMVDRLLDM